METWAPKRSTVKIRRPSLQRPTTPRTVQRRTLIALLERVVVAPPAGALALERFVAANHAIRVGVGVVAEAAANGATLREFHFLRSHEAGSIAGPPWRISKCKCGGSSGSEIPTPPISCPFTTVCPIRTIALDKEPSME